MKKFYKGLLIGAAFLTAPLMLVGCGDTDETKVNSVITNEQIDTICSTIKQTSNNLLGLEVKFDHYVIHQDKTYIYLRYSNSTLTSKRIYANLLQLRAVSGSTTYYGCMSAVGLTIDANTTVYDVDSGKVGTVMFIMNDTFEHFDTEIFYAGELIATMPYGIYH